MNKKTLFALAVLVQLLALIGLVGNYEFVKMTGKVVYIEAAGFDPTDLFRGDYVNVGYRFKITDEQAEKIGTQDGYAPTQYVIPKIDNDIIGGMESMTEIKPSGQVYIEVTNPWVLQTREILVKSDKGETLTYNQQWCEDAGWKIGEKVSFYREAGEISINYITKLDENNTAIKPGEPSGVNGETVGSIVSIGDCQKFLSITTSNANRFFVAEGTGMPLQEKIRKGEMYAKWSITKNGRILLLDIVEKSSIN